MTACVAAAVLAGIAQNRPGDPGDLVELDVVVLDRDNRPVLDLRQGDFSIKDDGRLVDVKTFAVASSEDDDNDGRQMVLLLDDSSVPMNGTAIVQAMAQAILLRKAPRDEVTVVRLNNDRDEPFGDVETALSRINAYHAGVVPFQNRGTAERVLRVVSAISKHLEGDGRRRKLIVCIGGPRVCNVLEPQPRGYSELWRPWVNALSAAARANVAVYAVMPVLPGTNVMLAGGLADATGGDGFSNASNFDRFVADLWTQSGAYYMLGYWPAESKRELRNVDVKVARKGVKVRARKYRG